MAMQAGDRAPFDPHRTLSIALACVEPAVHAALLSIEPFRSANRLSRSPLFRINLMSADDDQGPSMDIALPATTSLHDGTIYDLVLLRSPYEFGGDRKGAPIR